MAQFNPSQTSPKNPLENLMLQQLQQLISGERMLQKRYAQLENAADSNEELAKFEAEMIQLKTRADRLYRMMAAMSDTAFV